MGWGFESPAAHHYSRAVFLHLRWFRSISTFYCKVLKLCSFLIIFALGLRYFLPQDYLFLCHSRENGNPESRFRIKHGMTGKRMSFPPVCRRAPACRANGAGRRTGRRKRESRFRVKHGMTKGQKSSGLNSFLLPRDFYDYFRLRQIKYK